MANQFFSIIQSHVANQDKVLASKGKDDYPSNQLDHHMKSDYTRAHTNITPSQNDNEMTDMEKKKGGSGQNLAPLDTNHRFEISIL